MALGRRRRRGVRSPTGAEFPADLDDLPFERRVVRERTTAVLPPGDDPTDRDVLVAAPIGLGPETLGLLEAQFDETTFDDPQVDAVTRLAGALGRAFATLAERAGLQVQERTAGRLRDDLSNPDPSPDGAPDELPTAEIGDRRATDPAAPPTDPFASLTPRQRETLELMALGLSNAEIADRLVVGLSTAKTHVSAVLRACGAVNRAEVVTRYLDDRADVAGGGRATPS